MLNCGPGNSCCGNCASSGMGDFSSPSALPQPMTRVESVLYDWTVAQLASGQPFYVTPQWNSDVLSADGMGFFPAIFAAIAGVASTITAAAPTIASLAGTVGTVKALTGGSKPASAGPTAQDIANAVTPQVQAALAAQGVQLPNGVANQAVTASLLDSFGVANRPLVIGGLALGGVLLLMTLMKR